MEKKHLVKFNTKKLGGKKYLKLTQKPVHKCSQKVHSQEPKPEQLSSQSEWGDKLRFYLYHGRLLSTNKLTIDGGDNLGGSQGNYAE